MMPRKKSAAAADNANLKARNLYFILFLVLFDDSMQ